MLSIVVILILSYLLGSIPSSVWIGRWFYGVDVRKHGSHNAGATNVFRVLGWKAGMVTAIVDLSKGVAAAWALATIRLDSLPSGLEFWHIETFVRLLAGMAAIVGHMFPVWARFRGGKGVSTAAGVLFALTPTTMSIVLAIFIIVLLSSRYVSLASISAAATFPTAIAIRRYVFDIDALDPSLLFFGALLAISIFIAHRANIQRLINGTENRVRTFRLARGMRGRGEL